MTAESKHAPGRSSPAKAAVHAGDLPIGEYIPGTKLRILGVLGRGAFGTVYDCEDGLLGAPCAVKLVNADLARHPEIKHAAIWEGRQLASIDSDHVVKVKGIGITSESQPRVYINMFKLRGESLFDVLMALERIPPLQSILYASHVAMGLSAGHGKGLIHCDVKPANIFLVHLTDPVTGAKITRGVVLDYGVARIATTGDSEKVGFRGTRSTAAPEQFEGHATAQSDIYALGVTLHMMLTGRHPLSPFNNERDMVAAKFDAKRIRRLSDVLPNLSPGTFVDPELDDYLYRMMLPAPNDRPGTMGHVLAELGFLQEREEQRLLEVALKAKGRVKPLGRGAATVPESPELMLERIEAHRSAHNEAMSMAELEMAEPSVDELLNGIVAQSQAADPNVAAARRRIERFADGETSHIANANTEEAPARKETNEPRRTGTRPGLGSTPGQSREPQATNAASVPLESEDRAARAFFLGKSTLESATYAPGGVGSSAANGANRATSERVTDAPPPIVLPAADRKFRSPKRPSTMAGAVVRMPLQKRIPAWWRSSAKFRLGAGMFCGFVVLCVYAAVLQGLPAGTRQTQTPVQHEPTSALPSASLAAAPIVRSAEIPAGSRPEAPVPAPSEALAQPKPSGTTAPTAATPHPNRAPVATATVSAPRTVASATPPSPTVQPPAPQSPPPSVTVAHQSLLDAVNNPKVPPAVPTDIPHKPSSAP